MTLKTQGIGILAFGSLINDPGVEIEPLIRQRISTETTFPVEFVRISQARGGAPTLAPHLTGKPVKAELLVLDNAVSLEEARGLLWRREARRECTGETYIRRSSANAVLVCDAPGFCGLEHVLYTDFNAEGKISACAPEALAKYAVDSIAKAPPGSDGISYLNDLIEVGIETALTPKYIQEILRLTDCSTLLEARQSAVKDLVQGRISIGLRIPKTDGTLRPVTKLSGQKIWMHIGDKSRDKSIEIDMVCWMYEQLARRELVGCREFRGRFGKEYSSGPCRFSMVGGVLEYLKLAKRQKIGRATYYSRT